VTVHGLPIPAALAAVDDPLLARIEDAALTASQPREQAFHDGWVLRYANGKAKRARSVSLLGAGIRPLDAKLAYCERFYASHAVPLLLRLTPFSQPAGVDAALAERGFGAFEDTRVMVAAMAAVPAAGVADGGLLAVDRARFGDTLAKLHGLDPARAAVERARFAHSVGDAVHLVALDDGQPVACGSAVVDDDLVGLFGMVTAATHRGRGLATRLVAELLRQARGRGCTTAYLQVEAGNAPARRIYGKFGFRDGYAYWYRLPPTEGTTR
jgi:GNAT superfamily N-acetyltransferase